MSRLELTHGRAAERSVVVEQHEFWPAHEAGPSRLARRRTWSSCGGGFEDGRRLGEHYH